jgi:hypothetical protein
VSDEESKALELRNQTLADASHTHHRDGLQRLFESVITFSTEALKAAALINGGAAAGTLAFISQALQTKPQLAVALVGPIKCFGWGLFFAVLATGVAYFSQACFATSWSRDEYINEHPYILETKATNNWRDAGISFQVLAIALIFLAYILALYGFYLAANVLEKSVL